MKQMNVWLLAAIALMLATVLAVSVVLVVQNSPADGPVPEGREAAMSGSPGAQEALAQEPPASTQAAPPPAPDQNSIPPGAVRITGGGTGSDLRQSYRSIVSPSGATTCSFWEARPGDMECTVKDGSRGQSVKLTGGSFSAMTFTVDASAPTSNNVPMVLPYGQTAFYESFYCTSELHGMTCRDTATGTGVFLSKERVYQL